MPYKLDKINRQVLYELDRNARIGDAQLAKIVKRSREAVRNRIKKLVKDGIIEGHYASINPSKFGYMFFKLYFQLANIPEERERFYAYMKKLPGLYWFGGSDGVWDIHGTFYAKSVKDFNALKNKLFTDFRHLILKRDVGMLVNVRQYVKKYLYPESNERQEPTIFADDILTCPLDEADKQILNELAMNACISLTSLAKKIDSTIEVIRRRIKNMENKGIIMQYRIAINYTKLGYEMFKAFIYMQNLSEKDEKHLIEYAKQHTKIIALIRQLSAWDIEIEIVADDYEDFTHIMNDIREKFSTIIRNCEFCLMREDIFFFGKKEMF